MTKLLNSCGRIKNLCKTTITEHKTIMEYLTRRAARFRKEGRYDDDDLEKILKELEADEVVVAGMTDGEIDSAILDEMKQVQEALDKGLLQPHGSVVSH